MTAANFKLKPCGYARNADPQGHVLTVQRENLQDFLEFANVEEGYRVVCSCTMRGPLAGTVLGAIALHNHGLP